jgi:hypothetical protein
MLPPYGPDVRVEMAWPSSGATPKQPSMGSSRTVNCPSPVCGVSSVAVPAAVSTCHSETTGSDAAGRSATYSGSSTRGAIDELAIARSRFGQIRSNRTSSASPGSAPVT